MNLEILGAHIHIFYAIVNGEWEMSRDEALVLGTGQLPRTCDVEKQEKQESSKPQSLLVSNEVCMCGRKKDVMSS